MEVVDRSSRESVTVCLHRDELLAVNNVRNEVLHGTGVMDREEFHARIGVQPSEARAMLDAAGATAECGGHGPDCDPT